MASKISKSLATKTAEALNQLLEMDPEATNSLFLSSVRCNRLVMHHPTFCVEETELGPVISPLGVINGIIGSFGEFRVVIKIDETLMRVVGFYVVDINKLGAEGLGDAE